MSEFLNVNYCGRIKTNNCCCKCGHCNIFSHWNFLTSSVVLIVTPLNNYTPLAIAFKSCSQSLSMIFIRSVDQRKDKVKNLPKFVGPFSLLKVFDYMLRRHSIL